MVDPKDLIAPYSSAPEFKIERHSDLKIKLMQWNILAQAMCDKQAFPRVAAKYLLWRHRLPLIVEHIRHVNADLIGLCEVDVMANGTQQQELLDELRKLGYKSTVHEKKGGKSGSALLWKA